MTNPIQPTYSDKSEYIQISKQLHLFLIISLSPILIYFSSPKHYTAYYISLYMTDKRKYLFFVRDIVGFLVNMTAATQNALAKTTVAEGTRLGLLLSFATKLYGVLMASCWSFKPQCQLVNSYWHLARTLYFRNVDTAWYPRRLLPSVPQSLYIYIVVTAVAAVLIGKGVT